LALELTRYHTCLRIREQSVGEHSMQVLRVLLAIYPQAPRHMLVHCLVHDIGELASGDPPYPAKRRNADLKKACERIERDAHLSMCLPWGLPGPQTLTVEEYEIFKLAEFIEMLEWSIDEINLGNQGGHAVLQRCLEAIDAYLDVIDASVKGATNLYLKRRMNSMVIENRRSVDVGQ
jgi:5'-deoxynucleotidase YfbR-like HD superfamily hydrolase